MERSTHFCRLTQNQKLSNLFFHKTPGLFCLVILFRLHNVLAALSVSLTHSFYSQYLLVHNSFNIVSWSASFLHACMVRLIHYIDSADRVYIYSHSWNFLICCNYLSISVESSTFSQKKITTLFF